MKIIENINYGIANHPSQVLALYLPDNHEAESFDVFVYFHGGGIVGGDCTNQIEMVQYLTERNIAVVSANYRMYPTAVFPEFVMDAAAAVSWAYNHMSEYGEAKRFFVGGSSAGGYLSMMLCFDKKYLMPYGIDPVNIDGFIHDAGQPTRHFNVVREAGLDPRRVIVDEAAPLYHIGTSEKYAPMIFYVSDNDMENRYEQTMLMISTLKHFGHTAPDVQLRVLNGSHCHYIQQVSENGESVFGNMIYDYIKSL